MGNKLRVDHIGGWPKMLRHEPERPHEGLQPDGSNDSDETDQPYDISWSKKRAFEQSGNVYFVFKVFLDFKARGLYPPPWVVDTIAESLSRHLRNPDPELFATQVGVMAVGSGSKDRYTEYTEYTVWWNRENTLSYIDILLKGFNLTLTAAAKAMIALAKLDISHKTLVNRYVESYGSPKSYMLLHRSYDPMHDPFRGKDVHRQEFISFFPRKVQKILREKSPEIT